MNKISRILCLTAVLGFHVTLALLPARAQTAGKLTLREAVTLALQNSTELKLARVQYTVALNEAGVDRASFRPNLYTGSGAAYTYGFPSVPGGGAPAVFQMAYTQSVFNPLVKGEQLAAEERAKNQKLEIDRLHDDVIVRAATSYLELADVKHSLELMRNEEASAEKILGVTRDRVNANQELPIEVTRSELTLARTRERIIKLESRVESVSQRIRNLTGIPDDQPVDVETEEPSFTIDQQESEMANLAVQNDPGIQEAENERVARHRILQGARLSYLPTVEIVGQYSIFSRVNNYLEFYKNFQRNNVNLGVQITIPLFSAKTSANVALAKSQLQEAELSVGNKRQEVRLDILQKSSNMREVEATREVARLDMKLAQETLQLVQARLDQGRATLQDVEQARLDESDKWIAFLDADFARQQSQLTLLQATGQLAKVFQ
jgi:outer membrane protein TolC